MKSYTITIILALALVSLVRSSPMSPHVEPVIALDQMAPDHACLFLCNICFQEQEAMDELLECSNTVCGPVMEGSCAMDKFVWLGRHCRHYGDIERLWSSSAKH